MQEGVHNSLLIPCKDTARTVWGTVSRDSRTRTVASAANRDTTTAACSTLRTTTRSTQSEQPLFAVRARPYHIDLDPRLSLANLPLVLSACRRRIALSCPAHVASRARAFTYIRRTLCISLVS